MFILRFNGVHTWLVRANASFAELCTCAAPSEQSGVRNSWNGNGGEPGEQFLVQKASPVVAPDGYPVTCIILIELHVNGECRDVSSGTRRTATESRNGVRVYEIPYRVAFPSSPPPLSSKQPLPKLNGPAVHMD